MNRASVWRRLVGFVVDLSIIFSIGFLIIIPYNLILPLETTLSQLMLFGTIAGLTAGVLLLIRDIPSGGKSPGHYLTRTEIRIREGSVPSNRQLVLRNVPLLFWPIEAYGVIYHGFRHRFGDAWSDTMVVLEERSESKALVFGRWVSVFVVAVGGFYLALLAMQFNLTTLPAYEKAVEKIRSNPDVVSTVGLIQSLGWLPQGGVSINPQLGTAFFSIKVYGEQDTRWVYVRLINRKKDVWTVTNIELSNPSGND